MSLASAKRILMPAAVVLSVGWSALAVGFAWLTAPDAGGFRAAWQAQGGDPITAEQALRAAAATHAGATFGASPPKRTLARLDTAPGVVADRAAVQPALPAAAAEGDVELAGGTVEGIDQTRGARSGIALFAAFTAAVWLPADRRPVVGRMDLRRALRSAKRVIAAAIKVRAMAMADLCTAGIGRRKRTVKLPRRAPEVAAHVHAQRH